MANTTASTRDVIKKKLRRVILAGITPKTANNPALRTWDEATLAFDRTHKLGLPRPQTVARNFGNLRAIVNQIRQEEGLPIPADEETPSKAELLQRLMRFHREHAAGVGDCPWPTVLTGGRWYWQDTDSELLTSELAHPSYYQFHFGGVEHAIKAAAEAIAASNRARKEKDLAEWKAPNTVKPSFKIGDIVVYQVTLGIYGIAQVQRRIVTEDAKGTATHYELAGMGSIGGMRTESEVMTPAAFQRMVEGLVPQQETAA